MFPGQGSQRPGMGAPWQQHPSWRLAAELSDVAGRDLAHLLVDAGADELKQTRNAQLATYALSLVILEAAQGAGLLEPAPVLGGVGSGAVGALAGHSLGEYTALAAARALSPSQGAILVKERSEAMQMAAEANPGTMAAVIGLEREAVEEACTSVAGAWVANDNSPGQVVIAGTHDGVAAAGEAAAGLGAKRVIQLPVGGAFHSPLMEPAQQRLDEAIRTTQFGRTALPVIANVDAAPHTDGFGALLSAQLCSGVRWRESLTAAARLGGTVFLELGPGTELSGMVRRCLPDAKRANIASPQDLVGLGELLARSARNGT